MTFRPVSIRDTPPDLKVAMELHGLRSPPNNLQIERMAEDSLGDAAPNLNLNYNVFVAKVHLTVCVKCSITR